MGRINPIRYRGYYYDEETGLYYLNSRYYDPVTGRYLNMDDLSLLTYSPMDVTDKNLFAYCDNNPNVRMDASGEFWSELAFVVALVAGVVAVGAVIVATGGLAAVAMAGGGAAIAATSTASTALGVAAIAGEVCVASSAISVMVAPIEQSISLSYNPDPYARPNQKKQGRENKAKSRTKGNWQPRNNRRDGAPRPVHKHTPGRDHRKYGPKTNQAFIGPLPSLSDKYAGMIYLYGSGWIYA